MQNLISRLWNDLRARRLVPVAALLVGALIAAPVVLSKKADESPAPAPAPKAQAKKQSGPEELAQVKLDDAIGKGNGSSLSSFEESNPFAPPDKVVKAAQDETATDNGTAGTAPTDTGAVTPSTGTETGTGGGGDTTGGGTTGGGTPRPVAAAPPRPPSSPTSSTSRSGPTAASARSRACRSSTCCRASCRRC